MYKAHSNPFYFKGMTLVELLISILIISVSVIGILIVTSISIRSSGSPNLTHQAIAIAESYLQEISTKAFPVSPCPSPTGGRSTYTNICHYYNFATESPTDETGTLLPELKDYKVAVNVDKTTAQLGTLAAGTQVVRIDVTVSHAAMQAMTFSVYRTNYQ